MLKAATPLVTLAVGLAMRLEALSKLTLLSTALIALGTAIATASEATSGARRRPRGAGRGAGAGCDVRRQGRR